MLYTQAVADSLNRLRGAMIPRHVVSFCLQTRTLHFAILFPVQYDFLFLVFLDALNKHASKMMP